jgi:hypothetical protein
MEEATAAHRPLEMGTASRGQSAATTSRVWVWGSVGSAEFAEGIAYLHNEKVGRAPRWTGQMQAGRGGRLMAEKRSKTHVMPIIIASQRRCLSPQRGTFAQPRRVLDKTRQDKNRARGVWARGGNRNRPRTKKTHVTNQEKSLR